MSVPNVIEIVTSHLFGLAAEKPGAAPAGGRTAPGARPAPGNRRTRAMGDGRVVIELVSTYLSLLKPRVHGISILQGQFG
jgi:hypothetical protein